MRVLIGCEESQAVTKAFRAKGHIAYSCDIKETRGNHKWHFCCDVMDALDRGQWDLVILHPDCTAMAVSGNRWYGTGMPKNYARNDAVKWTLALWAKAIEHSHRVALENPVSVIFSHLNNVQYIQPWMFGHGESKKTGIALHNLPLLKPTQVVDGREQRVWRMPPGPNRKRDRSVTYAGIADAMATQWGALGNDAASTVEGE